MRVLDWANLGITPTISEAKKYVVITETLQQVNFDTSEATFESQQAFIFSIMEFGMMNNTDERFMSTLSTCTQRLKQMAFSLGTLENAEPPVFDWMRFLGTGYSRPSLGFIRSTLQILLSLGADINARWLGFPPLIYLFWGSVRIDTDNEESNTTVVTETVIVLLESGADLLALMDDGSSVFDAAEYNGRTSELALALQETGYDLDDVRQKIDLAQFLFFHPGVSLSRSTAVDRSQSTAGVVSRRAIAGDRLED